MIIHYEPQVIRTKNPAAYLAKFDNEYTFVHISDEIIHIYHEEDLLVIVVIIK